MRDDWVRWAMYAIAFLAYALVAFQLLRKLFGGSWQTERLLVALGTGPVGPGIAVHRGLSKLGGRFEQFEKRFDERFNEVDRRFDEVARRLDEIGAELRGLSARIGGMDTRLGVVEHRLGVVEQSLQGRHRRYITT